MDGLGIDPHWAWLVGGLLLATCEMLLPGVFLVWVGLAALVTGMATLLLGLPLAAQLALFSAVSVGSVYAARRWTPRHPPLQGPPPNERTAQLAGRLVEVVQAIEHGQGRVRVGDGEWIARGPDTPAGGRVRVVGAEGAALRVERADNPPRAAT